MAKRKNTPSPIKRQARKLSLAQKSLNKERLALKRYEEREFRHNVSKLKKLGVAFTRSTPKTKKRSSKSKGIIEQFRDIIEGRAKVHKIGKTGANKYDIAHLPGIRTIRNRLIVPIEPGTISYVRAGNLYRKRVNEEGKVLQRTQVVPVAIHSTSIERFIEELRDNPELEKSLKKGNYWSFRFFGNNSYATFETVELLANYWETYESVMLSIKEELEQQQEYIEALEIFQVPKGTNMRDAANGFKRYNRKQYRRSEYARSLYWRNKERSPERHEVEKAQKRERAIARYMKIKDNDEYRAKKRAADKARYERTKK